MARPVREGLSYYPEDVDAFEDIKIISLLDRFGPLGYIVWDVLKKQVYRSGYYIKAETTQLALMITRTVGSKWLHDKSFVLQVIDYCGELGLIDRDLLARGIITSVGIQKRYAKATVRNKVHMEDYLLIDEAGQSLISVPKKSVNVTETPVIVTETPVIVTETPQRKEKENKEKKSKRERKATLARQYGTYSNVELTDQAYNELKAEYPDSYIEKINHLSVYMRQTGKAYADHLATLRKWAAEDKVKMQNTGRLPTTYDKEEVEQMLDNEMFGGDYDG